ncbi:MAG TPA: hypothetical protein PLB59_00205 [Bacteroidales bacterium]|nr:hypothetical protein [Bacteroidales bacterium]HQN14853.1 hypothetical protein [Bacteroidales bacterium]HQP14365.1 hypothetical protein [Bacteroidales bacterium]
MNQDIKGMKPGLRLSDFFVILLLIGLPAAVFAQKPEAVASIDSNNILIGDQVKYSYKFTFPSAATPLMPVIADTLTKEVEVVSRTKMDTAVSADKKFTTFSQTLYISSFDSGTFVIPPMVFSYRQANDTTTYYASTNPIMLYVNTVSVDTTKEFKDIKMPLGEPLTWREILPWALLGFAVLLITGIVIYVWHKLRRKEPIIQLPQKPKIPPYEKALTELEALRIQKLWQSGKTKEFHSGLTDILRTYMEGQFQVEAMEMITSDVIASLKAAQLPQEEINRMEKILTLADMVKFAKFNPLPDEHDQSLKNGVLFVENTRPKANATAHAGTTNGPNSQKPQEEPKTE